MKKAQVYGVVFLFLTIISCNNDDDTDGGLSIVTPDPTEETILDPASISENITIKNGTRISGDAPQPTGSLDFTLNNTTQSAFLNNGFDISFDFPQDYAGAYIQVKSNEGSTVPDYFDIPYSLNRKPKNTSHALSKASKKIDDDDVEIDIDFNENITPGKFCYIICIYDTTGNISEPIEVCVEVESWGGNPNLTGTWNFTKRVRDGVTEFSIGGGECDSASIICEDDTELEIENAYCDVLTSLPITFNADGTYTSLETGTYTRYDYNLSIESCTVVLEEEQDETYTSKGNWAYDEEEQKLTLVEFEYAEVEGDETYEGTEENGYVLFDGKATITNSSLIVELDYESDEIEGTTYLAEFHFEK